MELPSSLDTSSLKFELKDWEKYIGTSPTVDVDVDCAADVSGYLKVGALLFVDLLLF